MRRQKFTISEFTCLTCGMKIPLSRRMGRKREQGHIKDIYCPRCGKVSKFSENRY